jgi:hypothetical protein
MARIIRVGGATRREGAGTRGGVAGLWNALGAARNCVRIYAPRTGDRHAILDAAAPAAQKRPGAGALTLRRAIDAGVLIVALGGCATSGTIQGWLSQAGTPPARVELGYTADALGPGGTLMLRLPDGESFTGPYTQGWSTIETAQPQVPGLGGVFFDWGGPQAGGFMEDDPIPVYQTEWSSKASANLRGDRGRSMSCRFRLTNPPARLAGGGEGRCLGSDGATIDLRF